MGAKNIFAVATLTMAMVSTIFPNVHVVNGVKFASEELSQLNDRVVYGKLHEEDSLIKKDLVKLSGIKILNDDIDTLAIEFLDSGEKEIYFIDLGGIELYEKAKYLTKAIENFNANPIYFDEDNRKIYVYSKTNQKPITEENVVQSDIDFYSEIDYLYLNSFIYGGDKVDKDDEYKDFYSDLEYLTMYKHSRSSAYFNSDDKIYAYFYSESKNKYYKTEIAYEDYLNDLVQLHEQSVSKNKFNAKSKKLGDFDAMYLYLNEVDKVYKLTSITDEEAYAILDTIE